jgi:hypothetical protein
MNEIHSEVLFRYRPIMGLTCMRKVPSSGLHRADGHNKIVVFFKSLSFYTNSVITISTLQVSSLRKLLVTHPLVKFLPCTGSRDRVVSTVIRLRVGRFGFRIPGRKMIVSFPRPPEWLWGPPTFLFNGYRSSFAGIKWTGNSLLPSFHVARSLIAVCTTFHY